MNLIFVKIIFNVLHVEWAHLRENLGSISINADFFGKEVMSSESIIDSSDCEQNCTDYPILRANTTALTLESLNA